MKKHARTTRSLTILLLADFLCSCHTSRTFEENSVQVTDMQRDTLSLLNLAAIDSIVAEFGFSAERLELECLPTGEARLTADNVTTQGRRERVKAQTSSQQQRETTSHNIRDSTTTQKDRQRIIIAEPPDTNRLLPILAVAIPLIAIAYLALKMRRLTPFVN